jgi:hypothetical protein
MIDFITQALAAFFLMGWTTQTHHPYEPPDVPLLTFSARTGARPCGSSGS